MVRLANDQYVNFGSFLESAATTVDAGLDQVNAGMAQYEAAGATELPQYAELVAKKAQLEGTKGSLNALQKYSEGVNLLCNQSSVGIAPVVGIDYKIGQFNP